MGLDLNGIHTKLPCLLTLG